MNLSDQQIDAIEQIKNIEKHFWCGVVYSGGTCWNNSSYNEGISQKGVLEEQNYEELPYYRLKGIA